MVREARDLRGKRDVDRLDFHLILSLPSLARLSCEKYSCCPAMQASDTPACPLSVFRTLLVVMALIGPCCRRFGIERFHPVEFFLCQVWEMANKMDQLPTAHIVVEV